MAATGVHGHGRGTTTPRGRGIGDDFVHAAVDDHSRLADLADAEILPDAHTFTSTRFLGLGRAVAYNHHRAHTALGLPPISRVNNAPG
ncbi:MAG: hypothetical protein L0Y54_17035 [Sporichthyaceae bacterium]|nr:hypothetical protein [Sporichthyaceae bacterium]